MEDIHFLDLIGSLLYKTEKEYLVSTTIYKHLCEWNALWATSLILMIHEEYKVELDNYDLEQTETIEELYERLSLKKVTV